MYLVITRHGRTSIWSPAFRIYDSYEDALKSAKMFAAQYHNEMQVRLYKLGEPDEIWNEENAVHSTEN